MRNWRRRRVWFVERIRRVFWNGRAGWSRRRALAAVINFPAMAIEQIDTKLSGDVREVYIHPVFNDLAIDHFPKIHVANFDLLSGWCDAEKLAAVNCLLPSESCCPLTHIETSLVDAHLVRESGLKGALPVFLKFLQALLGSATLVAAPYEVGREELADVINAVIVQPIDHGLNHRPGRIAFGGVGVLGEHCLFGA